LIVNKLEKALSRREGDLVIAEYWGMGFEDIVPVSAKASIGLTGLMDVLKEYMPQADTSDEGIDEASEDE
jgi:predicted GTPase